jgi:hypothetical protein
MGKMRDISKKWNVTGASIPFFGMPPSPEQDPHARVSILTLKE